MSSWIGLSPTVLAREPEKITINEIRQLSINLGRQRNNRELLQTLMFAGRELLGNN
jgi:hypothetical protein